MTTVQQIYEEMQRIAPLALAESWDNPGLLVDCGGVVSRVLVTLDITPEVVEEAARKGCGLIVSHHPVIFDPLKRLGPQDVPFQLVQAGISAVCMHTNLDAAEGGVNEVLAGIFGMKDMETFAEGCGRVGAIEEITVPELARKAQQELAVRCNAPALGPAPSMMAFMMAFFSEVRLTMSTSSFSFTRSMPMNLAAPSMPVPFAWMTVPPPAPAARAASMMEPVWP